MTRLMLTALVAAGCSATLVDEAPVDRAPVEHVEPSTLPIVVAEHPPPPISGGTLAIRDGLAVVGDPARLRIVVVNVHAETVRPIAVEGQPGRALVDGTTGYVLLRNRGRLLTIDLKSAEIIADTPVCAAPRGLAQHPDGALRVTCQGGALLKVDGDTVTRIGQLGADLRDVVVLGDKTYVSWFRSAVVGEVDEEGVIQRRFAPPAFERSRQLHLPAVVWRMVPTAHGTIAMVHQTAAPGVIPVRRAGGYGGPARKGCDGISGAAVSEIDPQTGETESVLLDRLVLPVDLAVQPTADGFGFFVPGAGNGPLDGLGSVVPEFGDRDTMIDRDCHVGAVFDEASTAERRPLAAGLTAVAVDPGMQLYAAFRPEPARLMLFDYSGFLFRDISLQGESMADTGMTLFHRDAGLGVACASCHPEGGDDGFAWRFEGVEGVRRTQMLRGGLKGTEPFHWEGDLADFAALSDEVFTHRMGGHRLEAEHQRVFIDYIDRMPDVRIDQPDRDQARVARGRAIFEREDVGCAACHVGGAGTDNRSHDVGTGGRFQTPALRGLAQRLPLMHTGCAPTVRARFEPDCGGGDAHGKTSHLGAAELGDLTRYLETL